MQLRRHVLLWRRIDHRLWKSVLLVRKSRRNKTQQSFDRTGRDVLCRERCPTRLPESNGILPESVWRRLSLCILFIRLYVLERTRNAPRQRKGSGISQSSRRYGKWKRFPTFEPHGSRIGRRKRHRPICPTSLFRSSTSPCRQRNRKIYQPSIPIGEFRICSSPERFGRPLF